MMVFIITIKLIYIKLNCIIKIMVHLFKMSIHFKILQMFLNSIGLNELYSNTNNSMKFCNNPQYHKQF